MIRVIGRFFRRYREENRGSTATEFALVGIPFMLMIFGVMEAGHIVWTMNGVQYAVEETSRYAAINSELDNQSLQSYAADKLSEMSISTSPLQITSSISTSNGIDFVQINASYEVSTMLNGLLPGDFGNFDFSASARKPVIN